MPKMQERKLGQAKEVTQQEGLTIVVLAA